MRSVSSQLLLRCVAGVFAILWCAPLLAESYEREVLADRPIAYYRFNEAKGTVAVDATGNGRDGTYKGEVILDAPSAYSGLGKAAAFGGAKSHVHIPKHEAFKFGKGDFSVEFWLNCRETLATRGDILSYKGEGKDFAFFKPAGNTNLLSFADPGRPFSAQTDPLLLGVWHHAVYVRRANVDQWYIDGELSGTATRNVMVIDMNADVLIGANYSGVPENIDDLCLWNGLIDELAFYNVALSSDRIRAHFEAAKQSGPAANSP